MRAAVQPRAATPTIATPPQGSSQATTTLFSSVDEYKGFWNNCLDPKTYTGNAVNCSGNSATARGRR